MKTLLTFTALAAMCLIPLSAHAKKPKATVEAIHPVKVESLIASYRGMLDRYTMVLVIEKIEGAEIQGYSLVCGRKRALTGGLLADGSLLLVEPGDDATDGKFVLSSSPDASKLIGKWQPNDPNLRTETLALEPRKFKAHRTQWSSKRYSESDLKDFSAESLKRMRNELYASHGHSFLDGETAAYFSQMDWYFPVHTEVKSKLSATEKHNETLLRKMEKLAEKNGNL